MNFNLSEDHIAIRDAAREFAQNEIAPSAVERDKTGEFPTEIVQKLGELGFMGMMVSPEYGGAGLDAVSYVLAMEEVSKVSSCPRTTSGRPGTSWRSSTAPMAC